MGVSVKEESHEMASEEHFHHPDGFQDFCVVQNKSSLVTQTINADVSLLGIFTCEIGRAHV